MMPPQKKKGGRGGGGHEEEGMVGGIFQVFTGEQRRTTCWHASRRCHVFARSAALSRTAPPCVHLCLLVFNLFSSSEQRSRQPSHSRAGLTSIGLEIERTPLSNQTSPRRAPSHSSKMSEMSLSRTFPGSSHTDSGV